ncbi:MAG: ABC transporter permease [Anaerolineae bacterium]
MAIVLVPMAWIVWSAGPGRLLETVEEAQVQRSLVVTLGSASLATVIGLVTGVPLAYLLARRRFPGKRALEGLLGLPVIIPHSAAGVALLLTYGARGPIGGLFAKVGVFFTDQVAGVVLAMLFVSVPFLISSAKEAIRRSDPDMEQVAQVDGASPWQSVWWITLPAARRGILAGALTMWARGISEFGAVALLAYHPRTLAVLTYERFQGFGLAYATPLAALLMLVSLAVFAVLTAFLSGDED